MVGMVILCISSEHPEFLLPHTGPMEVMYMCVQYRALRPAAPIRDEPLRSVVHSWALLEGAYPVRVIKVDDTKSKISTQSVTNIPSLRIQYSQLSSSSKT